MPHALIIRTAGTNCDRELADAFELAGATTQTVHLRHLIEHPEDLDRFDLVGLPGGFSYGDDLGAGKIFAALLREKLYPGLKRMIERGVPMFAPCNGFQVLVKMGLLPGPANTQPWPDTKPPAQTVTLTFNAGGRFIDQWVKVKTNPDSPCIWTQGLAPDETSGILPVAHGEGRFVADDATLAELEAGGFIALRYAPGENVNGSMNDIAGLCDQSGLIFGLMPHPERYVRWTQHPTWTRLNQSVLDTTPFGLQMFRNAVEHARSLSLV